MPGHRAFLAGSFLPSLSPAVQFLLQCSLCPRESPSTAPIQTSSRDLLATEQTPCDSERKDDARRAVVSSPYPSGPVGQITNHPLPLLGAALQPPSVTLGLGGIWMRKQPGSLGKVRLRLTMSSLGWRLIEVHVQPC